MEVSWKAKMTTEMNTPLTPDEYHSLMDAPTLTKQQYLRLLQASPLTYDERMTIYEVLYDAEFFGDDKDLPNFKRFMTFTKKELVSICEGITDAPKTKKKILGMFLWEYCERKKISYRIQNYIRVVHLKLEPYT